MRASTPPWVPSNWRFATVRIYIQSELTYSQSLVAESADIGTSMGSVEGTFNASNKLILRTSNAPITVDINLSNNADKSTELEMYTSNGCVFSSTLPILFSSKDTG